MYFLGGNILTKHINTPLTKNVVKTLLAGDIIAITGTIYTARDAAHKRMIEEYETQKSFPFNMENSIIYYVGPTPTKPGQVTGSAGPTTSYRMDTYAPFLIERGLTGMIGKGSRNKDVVQSMKKNTSVYFAAIGGAAALISNHIKSCKIIAYDNLGAEAVHELYVENFPCIVVIDCLGNDLYETEKQKYKK